MKNYSNKFVWSGLSTQTKGGILVFLGAVFFSTKAIFVKLAYQYEVQSIDLLALRMLFSLPFFLLMIYIQRAPKSGIVLHWRDWLQIFALGVLGYYLASLFDFWGLQYITASLERLVLFAYPTIVLLVSAVLYQKPIKREQLFALFLTYSGILIAFWGDFQLDSSPKVIWGSILVFVSAITFAFYLIGSGQMIPRLGSLRFNALAMTGASIGVLCHAWVVNGLEILHFAPEVYAYSIGMALVATVLASFLLTAGISKVGASNAAIISSIGPISTIILANVFLGEIISVYQIVGTAFVMLGVLMITLQKAKPESKKVLS